MVAASKTGGAAFLGRAASPVVFLLLDPAMHPHCAVPAKDTVAQCRAPLPSGCTASGPLTRRSLSGIRAGARVARRVANLGPRRAASARRGDGARDLRADRKAGPLAAAPRRGNRRSTAPERALGD